MKPSVYLETTIPSYLTARPSRDLILAAHQQVTREWWLTGRDEFDLFISQFVLDEAAEGDAEAAAERLKRLTGLPRLEITEAAVELADRLIRESAMPAKASADAFHVAIAVVNNMDYLLTWNCAHIASVRIRPKLESVCAAAGWRCPMICTPLEMLEDDK